MQTGKAFLVRHSLKGVRVYDLLDTSIYPAFSRFLNVAGLCNAKALNFSKVSK